MKKNIHMLLWGIVLLVFGGVFLVGRLMGNEGSFFFPGWWTVFLIVPALASMVENRVDIGNIIVLLLGVMLLARAQGWIPVISWTLGIAIVLVVLGLYFVLRAVLGGRSSRPHSHRAEARMIEGSFDANPSYTAILSSRNVKSQPISLLGATCTAVLGSASVDLSDCIVEEDITIFCNAILGSVDVIVPQNVKIVYRNLPILGDVSGKALGAASEANVPTVTLDCTAVLGAVTVS